MQKNISPRGTTFFRVVTSTPSTFAAGDAPGGGVGGVAPSDGSAAATAAAAATGGRMPWVRSGGGRGEGLGKQRGEKWERWWIPGRRGREEGRWRGRGGGERSRACMAAAGAAIISPGKAEGRDISAAGERVCFTRVTYNLIY